MATVSTAPSQAPAPGVDRKLGLKEVLEWVVKDQPKGYKMSGQPRTYPTPNDKDFLDHLAEWVLRVIETLEPQEAEPVTVEVSDGPTF